MLVGLAADTGERGDRGIALGVLSENDGRVVLCAAEMFKDSAGLAAERAAYIVDFIDAVRGGQLEKIEDKFGFDRVALVNKGTLRGV